MARPIYVDQPKDRVIQTRNGKMTLKWDPNLAPRWNNRYWRGQRHIDGVVLYGCEEFIPVDTGDLILSGRRATRIGSGWVCWSSKHSRPVYYGFRAPGRKGPKIRGPVRWFGRWKAANGKKAAEATANMVVR